MKLYADSPTRRVRQMVGDALLLAWILIWIEIGKAVHDADGKPLPQTWTRSGRALLTRSRSTLCARATRGSPFAASGKSANSTAISARDLKR